MTGDQMYPVRYNSIPKKSDLIVGIDPGFSGALAFYHIENDRPFLVIDMPLLKVQKGKGKLQSEIDTAALAEAIAELSQRIKFAVVEDVHAMPGQGVVSMFRFGESKGIILGVLASHQIPIYLVAPATWKMLTGLSRDKNASRHKVMSMYPESADDFKRVKDDGRAEALLLAIFGRRFLAHSN